MKTVSIRKYGNRKMYDGERAAYLSMLELSGLVAQGVRVTVTCDLTGDDLTFQTLARALYERSKLVNKSTSTLRHLSGDEVANLSAAVEKIIVKMPVKKDC
jgi:polyhydroxyalkanoate synthesis regulator protein